MLCFPLISNRAPPLYRKLIFNRWKIQSIVLIIQSIDFSITQKKISKFNFEKQFTDFNLKKFFQNRLTTFSPFNHYESFELFSSEGIMQHGFEPKPHSHIPNLSLRPKLPPSSMMAWSNPLASFDPCRLHHIVGFIKLLETSVLTYWIMVLIWWYKMGKEWT